MPDLVAEFNAAAENVRQVHLSHIKGLGVTGQAIAALWQSQGLAPFGVATVEPRPGGSFLFGAGAAHIVQPVIFEGELVDLVAWRSLTPERWLSRTGVAWCLGEDALEADHWNLTKPDVPTIHATPLEWLRTGGDGFCILDWDSPEIRLRLIELDAIRCTNRILEKTLIDAISKPVRLPRINRTEVLADVA